MTPSAPAAGVRTASRTWSREAVAGLALVLGLVLLAALAPCLAGRRPVFAVSDRGVRAPALRDVLRPLPRSSPATAEDEIEARWRIMPPIPHDPLGYDLNLALGPPDGSHWLGTDEIGRDLLARLVHGSRPSLLVALIATCLSLLVGVPIGAAAGYGGARWDLVLSRLIEASLSFPALVLLLLLTALWLRPEAPGAAPDSEPLAAASLLVIGVAVAAVRWAVIARYTRAEVRRLAESDFAIAARAAGAAAPRVLFRHLVPCAMTPVVVSAAFGAGSAVIAEASLSFLGLGMPAPTPTWGQMIAKGCEHGLRAWWLLVFPGAMVALTVAAFNLVGEGLRGPRRT